MLAAHGQPNALPFELLGDGVGKWLSASAQLADDGSVLVVQLVHMQLGDYNTSTVTLSAPGFAPGGVVDVVTLSVPADSPWGNPKTDGNTPGDPLRISPQASALWWPAGASSLDVQIPAFSFTMLKVYAK